MFLELTLAYQRRKKWEADLQAASIRNLLGRALSKKDETLDLTEEDDAAVDAFMARFGGSVQVD